MIGSSLKVSPTFKLILSCNEIFVLFTTGDAFSLKTPNSSHPSVELLSRNKFESKQMKPYP